MDIIDQFWMKMEARSGVKLLILSILFFTGCRGNEEPSAEIKQETEFKINQDSIFRGVVEEINNKTSFERKFENYIDSINKFQGELPHFVSKKPPKYFEDNTFSLGPHGDLSLLYYELIVHSDYEKVLLIREVLLKKDSVQFNKGESLFTNCIIWENFILSAKEGFEENQIIEAPIYSVVNKDLICVLDSFIKNEMDHDNYDPNVLLFCNIMDSNGVVLQFSSGGKKVYEPFVYEYNVNPFLAVFYHKTHTFIIHGRSIISSELMMKSKKTYPVKIVLEKDKSAYINEDGSYFPTTWFGKLRDGKFVVTNKLEM